MDDAESMTGLDRPVKKIKLENDCSETTLLLAEPVVALKRKGGRQAKKTSAERAAELLKDPRLSAIEPTQVLCRMCGNWIRLLKHSEYAPANWRSHAERCEARTNWQTLVKMEPSNAFELTINPQDNIDAPPVEPNAAQTMVTIKQEFPRYRAKRNLEERRLFLLNDDRVEDSDAHRVLCKLCHSWVKLHNMRDYDIYNWHRHIERCEQRHRLASSNVIDLEQIDVRLLQNQSTTSALPPSVPQINETVGPPTQTLPEPPSKKRKSRSVEERLQALVDDPRCDDVKPDQVHCVKCKRWVKLQKDMPYIDSNWQRHASKCAVRTSRIYGSLTVPKIEDLPFPLNVDLSVRLASGSCSTTVRDPDTRGGRKGGKTAEQRAQDLRDDPRTAAVEPDRVLCKVCDTWVKLQIQRDYDTWNWRRHVEKCGNKPKLESSKKPRGRPRKQPPSNPELVHTVESDSESDDIPTPPSAPVRTREDRRQILLDDNRCGDIHPNRVSCKLCSRTIGLHSTKEYFISNWFRHVERCEVKQRLSTGHTLISSGPLFLELEEDGLIARPPKRQKIEEEDIVDLSASALGHTLEAPAAAAESLPFPEVDVDIKPSISRNKTADERKAQLESDLRAGPVETNRIYCKLCDRWLKLSDHIAFSTFNWYKHVSKCETKARSANVITKRQTAESRKQRFREDPRVETVEPSRALCKLCGHWIKLRQNIDYDVHNWLMHADRCEANSRGVNAPIASQSSHAPAPKLSAEERGEALRQDTRCATVEPYRVLCGLCNEWIRLRSNQQYGMYNWQRHVEKCEKLKRIGDYPGISSQRPIVIKDEPDTIDNLNASSTIDKVRAADRDDQREAQLRADPRLDGVELGRVHCRMCNSWIRLNMSHSYVPGNWLRHAERCEAKTKWRADGAVVPADEVYSAVGQVRFNLQQDGIEDLNEAFGFIELGHLVEAFEPIYSSTTIPVTHPQTPVKRPGPNPPTPIKSENSPALLYPMTDSGRRVHRTTEQRRQDLEADPRTSVVNTDQVLCKLCHKWIQLRKDVAYSGQNWLKHASICEMRYRRSDAVSVSVSVPRVKTKQGSPSIPQALPSPTSVEEDPQHLPYSAKLSAARSNCLAFASTTSLAPAFKPVDWSQTVASDTLDDEGESDYGDEPPWMTRQVQIKTEPIGIPMSIFEFERGFVPSDFSRNVSRLNGRVPLRPMAIEV